MSKTTYGLIMQLPEQYARGGLFFILLPLFESGLPEERIQHALDPLFARAPIPVKAGRRKRIGAESNVPVTEIAKGCEELMALHLDAWECVVRTLGGKFIHPSKCREGFYPFVRDRSEGFCPAHTEFVCDTVVLDRLDFQRSGRIPIKTWRLQ